MRRFHFRLEKLLGIRRHKEEKLEIELGKAVSRCISIQQDIDKRTAERSRIMGNTGSDNIQDELVKGAYIYRMEREAERLTGDLAEAEKEKEKAKEKFLAASRDRKVLDKLKERKRSEFNKEQSAEEIKTSDDMVSANYGRGRWSDTTE